MFRRSREDAGDPRRRRHRFAAVRITRAESRLQRLLERYSREVWREAPRQRRGGATGRHDSAQAGAVVAGGRRALAAAPPRTAPLARGGQRAAAAHLVRRRTRGWGRPAGRRACRSRPGRRDARAAVAHDPGPCRRRGRGCGLQAAMPASAAGSRPPRTGHRLYRVSRHAAAAGGRPAPVAAAARRVDDGRARVGAGAIQRRRRSPAGDRCGRGGTQSAAAVPASRELRAPLEPGASRTADRSRGSHRPAAHGPRHHAGRPRHRRGSRHRQPRAPPRPDRRDAGRKGPARRVPQRRADGPHGDRWRARPDRRIDTSLPPSSRQRRRLARMRGRPRIGCRWSAISRVPLADEGSDRARQHAPRLAIPLGGFVVAIRCAARTEDGEVVASRVVLVHAAAPRPAAGDARRGPGDGGGGDRRPAGPGGDRRRCAPGSRPWRRSTNTRSTVAVPARRPCTSGGRRTGRSSPDYSIGERSARPRRSPAADRAIHAEHRRRIDGLDRARRPRLSCTPVAVLVVWR